MYTVTLAFLTFDRGISVNSAPVAKKKRTRSWNVIEYHLYPRTSERNNIDLQNLSSTKFSRLFWKTYKQTNENPWYKLFSKAVPPWLLSQKLTCYYEKTIQLRSISVMLIFQCVKWTKYDWCYHHFSKSPLTWSKDSSRSNGNSRTSSWHILRYHSATRTTAL